MSKTDVATILFPLAVGVWFVWLIVVIPVRSVDNRLDLLEVQMELTKIERTNEDAIILHDRLRNLCYKLAMDAAKDPEESCDR